MTLTSALRDEIDRASAPPSATVTSTTTANTPEKEKDDDRGKDSQATLLVRLARDAGAEFFHDDDVPYLRVRVGDHAEVHRLRSRTGKGWLVGLFLDAVNKAPGSQAITDALNTLEALALRGPDQPVYVRIAALDDRIYIDPADASWTVIEVSRTGWKIITDPPVRFRRPKGLLSLPIPRPGGSVGDLRCFVNLASGDDFILFVAVLLGWLRGRGPYPILVENGEQGSAKSTLTRIVKSLIDPNVAPLRSAPREPRDLMIAAANSHLIGFDNLSNLPDWLSDALCRLSTGGGFSTRTLYSDDEEHLIDAVRPVVLNGITDLASRQDLVGRSVFVTLPPIPDGKRRDEATFWADFERVRPKILGALLDIVSVALRNEPTTTLDSSPRMADFARWIVSAEPACPWPAGTFLSLYAGNRHEAIAATLDGDPVVNVLHLLLKTPITTWTGTASELLETLNRHTSEAVTKRRDWFSKPRQVSDALRRLAPSLRTTGINVVFCPREGKRRPITVTRLEQEGSHASCASPASSEPENTAFSGDAATDAGRAASPSSSLSSPQNPHKTGLCDAHDAYDAGQPLYSNEPDGAASGAAPTPPAPSQEVPHGRF